VPNPVTVLVGLWVAWWLSWLAAAVWSDRPVSRPPRRQEIPYRACVVIGVVLLSGLFRHDFRSEVILWQTPQAVSWTMVALAVCGFAFTWWARLHLGRLWSSNVTRKSDHRVVDSGPYAIVRHPIYTGITLATVATAVLRGTATGWAGAGLMTLGWIIKARLEEGFLREELGAEAYDTYARRVPMLVPFLR
jgi:protein-S-isoprenylcysteine O-methyltransferase Ste14